MLLFNVLSFFTVLYYVLVFYFTFVVMVFDFILSGLHSLFYCFIPFGLMMFCVFLL